jgi:hypothetical protein
MSPVLLPFPTRVGTFLCDLYSTYYVGALFIPSDEVMESNYAAFLRCKYLLAPVEILPSIVLMFLPHSYSYRTGPS